MARTAGPDKLAVAGHRPVDEDDRVLGSRELQGQDLWASTAQDRSLLSLLQFVGGFHPLKTQVAAPSCSTPRARDAALQGCHMLFALCYRAGPGLVSCYVLLDPACSLLVVGMRQPESLDMALLLGESSSPELQNFFSWLSKSVGCVGAVQQERAGGGWVEGPCQNRSTRRKTRVPNILRT